MLANGYADEYPGSRIEKVQVEVPVLAYEQVLIESGIPKCDWMELKADMQTMLNSTPDAGRPSDAMRSAIYSYRLSK